MTDEVRAAAADDLERLDSLFHRLWTKSVGQPGYDKAEWREMERALLARRGREAGREVEEWKASNRAAVVHLSRICCADGDGRERMIEAARTFLAGAEGDERLTAAVRAAEAIVTERDQLRERVRRLEEAARPFAAWAALPDMKGYEIRPNVRISYHDSSPTVGQLRHLARLVPEGPAPPAPEVKHGDAKATRLRKNDANYCRLKRWTVGTVLTLGREHHVGRSYLIRVRVTAVGEDSIVVRRVYDTHESAEMLWKRRLVNIVVVQATPPTEDHHDRTE